MADIRTELGLSGSISLNTTTVRTLLGKSSGIIQISDAYGKTKPNTFTAAGSNRYTGSFDIDFAIGNAAPNKPVSIRITASSAGQPLGEVLTGTTDSIGNWSFSGTNYSPDPYWYPRVKSCTFAAYVDNIFIGGGITISS